jgi:hypothetical protein
MRFFHASGAELDKCVYLIEVVSKKSYVERNEVHSYAHYTPS